MAGKSIPSKRQLEIQLAKLKTLDSPNLKLEQYPVSPETAAELLYMAGFEHDDLKGSVIDLGTGTGRLAIGASLMGSPNVVGTDIDRAALTIARGNAETVNARVEWVESSIDKVQGTYDTVLMNPPYGTRMVHEDVKFLDKAFELANVVYTIHKSSTRDYLIRHAEKSHRKIDSVRRMNMNIPHLFEYHTRKWKSVEVDLYRII